MVEEINKAVVEARESESLLATEIEARREYVKMLPRFYVILALLFIALFVVGGIVIKDWPSW